MHESLLLFLIAGPIVFGLLALACRTHRSRIPVILGSAVLTAVAGVWLAANGSFKVELPSGWASVSSALELAVIGIVTMIGWRIRSWVVVLLALTQLAMALTGMAVSGSHGKGETAAFLVDPLSVVLVLIITIVGSLIVVYAIGYMKKHEEHSPRTAASTSRFFFFLIAFLGFMDGLVLTDDLKWLSIFWECTTLCSFFLIGHDGTDEARRSARWALVVNTFGGAMMTAAGLVAQYETGNESLSALKGGALLLPVALLCIAAFTKSAQMPFQSWLLGAMVAPTPVSALLHSSTMVKAGSYLVLRLAPAFGETALSPVVAAAGAFTFAVACALAIGQSNGKKVLAYSTIANLGLIVACAGLNTPLAFSAALMILCFHAVSKALLFLCVGAIEQTIGSRDIEDMSGIFFKMPLTTIVTVVGMVSMVVPPFGMLIGKWMAIEASVHSPIVLMALVIGSALTIFFWAKWIGRITTVSYHEHYALEKLDRSMVTTLLLLVFGVICMAGLALPMYRHVAAPVSIDTFAARSGLDALKGELLSVGSLTQWPIFGALVLALAAIAVTLGRFGKEQVRLPFLCGENAEGDEHVTYNFRSLMDEKNTAYVAGYYLPQFFGEDMVTAWANPVATMILMVLMGVIV